MLCTPCTAERRARQSELKIRIWAQRSAPNEMLESLVLSRLVPGRRRLKEGPEAGAKGPSLVRKRSSRRWRRAIFSSFCPVCHCPSQTNRRRHGTGIAADARPAVEVRGPDDDRDQIGLFYGVRLLLVAGCRAETWIWLRLAPAQLLPNLMWAGGWSSGCMCLPRPKRGALQPATWKKHTHAPPGDPASCIFPTMTPAPFLCSPPAHCWFQDYFSLYSHLSRALHHCFETFSCFPNSSLHHRSAEAVN
jgi:hypothetical protein